MIEATSSAVWVRPSEVFYTQETISAVFGTGQQTIEETFRRLVNGKTAVCDVRPLTVFRYRNKYWAYNGNKRLFIFRKLEEFGLVETIQVNVLTRSPFETGDIDFCKNTFTTINGGNDVTVRGPGGCRISGTLATIYRKSVLRRQTQSPSTTSTPSRHRNPCVADTLTSSNLAGSSSLPGSTSAPKRRALHALDTSMVTSSALGWSVSPPPPSPYPQSPAVITDALPYCVVVFGLLVVGLISSLLLFSDFQET